MRFVLTSVALLFLFSSCAAVAPGASGSAANKEVIKRASYDFNCPQEQVTAKSLGKKGYTAQGCGQEGKYQVLCSLGPCRAEAR